MTNFEDSISGWVWNEKYRFKRPDGTPIDVTVNDTFERVAVALAKVETTGREYWEERFFSAIRNFEFLPAGRILAGAGTGRDVTCSNCFVLGNIEDSLAGIMQACTEGALTLKQGGGIGMNFSTLRHRGAAVKGVGSVSSGSVSFMELWNTMCATIMSAGSRRGAMMSTLRVDHPDVEEFIEAKQTKGRLTNFNVSVAVTDAFMQAVENDEKWPLVFNGEQARVLPSARALWDKILRSTYDYAEPGVIFIDRVNNANPLRGTETLFSTNPCVTADTWVHTADGARQVSDLIGPFQALVDGKPHSTDGRGFFLTGRKPVFRLRTKQGHTLRLTADHKVMKVDGVTRYSERLSWTAAGELAAGDKIVLHNHRGAVWGALARAESDDGEGYLLGLMLGDGWISDGKAALAMWRPAVAVGALEPSPETDPVMMRALTAYRAIGGHQDWWQAGDAQQWRIHSSELFRFATSYGLKHGYKAITPEMESQSSAFYTGLLRGLFDTDGSVQGDQSKGASIRLTQVDAALLESVQRLLLRLGIASTVYYKRKAAGHKLLPDGKGGLKEYPIQELNELVISGDNIRVFAERVGLLREHKALRLKTILASYKRAMNVERFFATVASVEPDGEEDVFDVSIPGINAFDANALYVHNCGEQPLPPYGACILGSINLAALVKHPFTPQAYLDIDRLNTLTHIAVRMLDNVNDVSRYPLEQQYVEAQSKRRIGLGITGFADMLIMLGFGYREAGPQWAKEVMRQISEAAMLTSRELAEEKGAYPLWKPEHGPKRRNSHLTSIAPTGTISLFAGNVSSGIEPVFDWSYTRKVLKPDGAHQEFKVEDYASRLHAGLCPQEQTVAASIWQTAADLLPQDHLSVVAMAQPYVDSAISKTINCPVDISFEDFKDVYTGAYKLGLKGCTTYRPNATRGSILSSDKMDGKKVEEAQVSIIATAPSNVVQLTPTLVRGEQLDGSTYKIKPSGEQAALYVTINDILDEHGRRRPYELFFNSKAVESASWMAALSRMISAVFRKGGDVAFVADELSEIFDPRGGFWQKKHYVPSVVAAVGLVLKEHMHKIGFADGAAAGCESDMTEPAKGRARHCPQCQSGALTSREGCWSCDSCTYTKCG